MSGVVPEGETESYFNTRFAGLAIGVVLAGGLSRRMGGGDKGLIDIGGQTMLARAVARLQPQVGRVILNANGDPARLSAFGLPVVPDAVEGFAGPLAGVLTGMLWARDHAPDARWVVTVAGDTPFFPDNLVARFVEAAGHDEAMIALAASGGHRHPVFGLWPVALADDLHAFLDLGESRKVLAFVDRHPDITVNFPGLMLDDVAVDPFFNVNTPEDIDIAEAIADALTEKEAATV